MHCLLRLIKTDQRTRSALLLPGYRVDVSKLTSIPLVEIASAFYFSLNLECVSVRCFEFLTHRLKSAFLSGTPLISTQANVSDS